MKHKHAELIKAWADGAEIQWRYSNALSNEWHDFDTPERFDHKNLCLRIKPKQKPDIEKFFILESNLILGLRFNEIAGFKKQSHEDWIRVIFDAETAKIKSAEVLK